MLLHPQQPISLDHAHLLIHGNPASLGAVAASLINTPDRTTAIVEATADSSHLVGQVLHQPGCRVARMTFLSMDAPTQNATMPALIDFLCFNAGEKQACNVITEVEGSSALFETFRRSGFSTYGIETIWRMPLKQPQKMDDPSLWRQSTSKDEIAMRTLYQKVTPPLEQSAELYQPRGSNRMVYYLNDEVLAWVQYTTGPLGIYLIPVVHLSIKNPDALLYDLLNIFINHLRPVYLQVRSHQSWLNGALEAIGAQPSGQYTLLVKHMALSQKVSVSSGAKARVEARQVKPTAPILRNLTRDVSPTESKSGLK